VPRLALANNLYRGQLPDEFKDLTWVEEMVCSIYRNIAHITRLFNSTADDQPTVLHGNTCAHEMNVVSTARVLPRTPSDINGMLSIVFVGPGKFQPEKCGNLFRVRKDKIWCFLMWLKSHNKLYALLDFDKNLMDLFPEDGPLPGIEQRAIHHEISSSEVSELFHEETAGFEDHPASSATDLSPNDLNEPLVEKMGVIDPECTRIPARSLTANALRRFAHTDEDGKELPDLVLHRGADPISEYNNPALVPGMYPTLYPFGIGGFEDKSRPTALSFESQAKYYLNIPNKSFRYHFSYLFVILNMIQRRKAHLHTHFTVNASRFKAVAHRLTSLSAETIAEAAEIIENERNARSLDDEQRKALELLRYVNTISEKIPGSFAAKISTRADIRSYFSYFGLAHLFFTFNPSPLHSPIFQVMYGDKSIDLSTRFPIVPSARERARRLAQDPVAAADFFEFSVKTLFESLLGWDYAKRQSSKAGGIWGRLRAFYGTTEYTERGSLHGHFLIWLEGAENPSDIHQRLSECADYKSRFFTFFESIIHHHLPDIEIQPIDSHYNPRIERPPLPPDPANQHHDAGSKF
jgi:hypothetical protein